MVYFHKFFESKTGAYMLSIIIGLGLASLFRNVCKDKNCMVFKAPPMEDIEKKVYKIKDKCYKYQMGLVTCDKKKTIVPYSSMKYA